MASVYSTIETARTRQRAYKARHDVVAPTALSLVSPVQVQHLQQFVKQEVTKLVDGLHREVLHQFHQMYIA